MSSENAAKKPNKDEIIAAIQECAAKLGHVPSQAELKQESGIGGKIFARQFGNYTRALRASGFEGRGSGFMLGMEELFEEWAGIVRKTGALAEEANRSRIPEPQFSAAFSRPERMRFDCVLGAQLAGVPNRSRGAEGADRENWVIARVIG